MKPFSLRHRNDSFFMKQLIYLFLFLFVALSYGQNTGLIVGKVMDGELENAPLVLADVSIKGMDVKANTDITGLFLIENLQDGDYTLVCSFAGYETKEFNVHISSGVPVELNLELAASTISLDEIALLTSVAQKEDTSNTALN